jgi:hypothetical protein
MYVKEELHEEGVSAGYSLVLTFVSGGATGVSSVLHLVFKLLHESDSVDGEGKKEKKKKKKIVE